jgi:hypothetical protein
MSDASIERGASEMSKNWRKHSKIDCCSGMVWHQYYREDTNNNRVTKTAIDAKYSLIQILDYASAPRTTEKNTAPIV